MLKLTYSNTDQRGDFVRNGANLETDDGLETIVTVCLFSDARAQEADEVDADAHKRGWWGSLFIERELGSRLWLLQREKLTDDTLILAGEYAKESLGWLVKAGVAASAEASAERFPNRPNIALLSIAIERQRKSAPRFQRAWEVQFGI